MNKVANFYKRNLKEVLRDPIIYIFCLGFPVIMMLLFFIINKFTGGATPTFEIKSLLAGIVVFSYSFVMLTLAIIVSKDRESSFLKRLFSAPMKARHFILGYGLVGLFIGLLQTLLCVVTALILSLATGVASVSVGGIALLFVSQLPILITNICLGILFGTIFSDKTAPGVCSIFISISGILGGCWMPVETMGAFETFCKCLPYYPSVYIGRVVCGASNALGVPYVFDTTAILGLIPIVICMVASVVLSIVIFKKKMICDN